MIEISQYRNRIGTFYQKNRKIKTKNYVRECQYSQQAGSKVFFTLKSLLIVICQVVLLYDCLTTWCKMEHHEFYTPLDGELQPYQVVIHQQDQQVHLEMLHVKVRRAMNHNFLARYTYGNRQSTRGIRNFHLNIRSLVNKVSEIKCIIKNHNPHIIGLSECEVRKSQNRFDEKRLKIPGYNILFPKSWSAHGFARVIVYVKSSVSYEQVDDLEDDVVQSVWLKAGFKNSKQGYYCHAYREHTSTLGASLQSQRIYLGKFLNQWEDAIAHSNAEEPNEVHIAGDLNIDVLNDKWLNPDYHLASLSSMLLSACNLGNFKQLVTKPTRSQFNSIKGTMDISCIDHIYTNYRFRCSKVSVESFGASDHDLIGYTRFSKDPPTPPRTIRKRSYKKFNPEDFLEDLREADWLQVNLCKDVDEAVSTFTNTFKDVLDKHAPWILFQERKRFVPWLSQETEDLMKKRNKLKEEALKQVTEGKDSSLVWLEYKQIRNQVNNRRKFEEKNFKQEQLKRCSDSPANTWKTAKHFMGWNSSSGPPNQLLCSGKLVTRAAEIATEMNRFFMDKVRLIREGINFVPNRFNKCLKIMENKNCELTMRHVTVIKVKKLLKQLKGSKSISIDGLDSFSVKTAADVIAAPLHHIITLSILQEKFPTSWKYSKVIPLHKKGSQLEKKNYRPVAILSPLSKVLEKIVFEQMYEYFSRNKIFHENLHGYRQYRSTQTALLSMYDRWVRNASKKQVSGVILLDLSAAFDLVEPDILLKKLRIYGLKEDYLNWIQSYLTNRFQAVWIHHILSNFLPCDIGVPQGSNLGPLFFLIFFNDLPENLSSEVDSYADDTTLTTSGSSVDDIGDILTEDCKEVSIWMKANKLKVNPEKTHILTMGTQQRLSNLAHKVIVNMDGVQLQDDQAGAELLLGCKVQANLKWHKHVAFLKSKLSSRLMGLMNLRYIAPYRTRNTIAEGIFNSVLVYCLPLFGGCDAEHIKAIQVLQNKAVQIVCHAPPRSSRAPLYDRVGWLTVNQLIAYHTLISVFKIRRSGEPEYLARILKNENINSRINIPVTNLSLAMKSFSYRGAREWNNLPTSLRNILSISQFKKELKKWVHDRIPRFLE